MPKLAVDPDIATALLDDAVDGGQAKPGALADVLRGKEGLEDLVQHFARHPAAVVAQRHEHIASMPNVGFRMQPPVLRPQRDNRRFDAHLAASARGFTGIERQVDEHLVQLTDVGPDLGARCIEEESHVAILAHGPLQGRGNRAHDLIELHDFRAQQLPAAERQQLGGDRRRTLAREPHLLDVLAHFLGKVGVLQHELGTAEYHRHLVVHFVGDTSSKTPHRFRAFHLPEPRLKEAATGDVLAGPCHRRDGA